MSTPMKQSAIREIWDFCKTRKKYWLIPILLVLMTLGILLVVVQGSVVSPFVYTLF